MNVASRPKESFAPTGLSKRAWLVLLIVFTVFTYFVGLGLALNYVLKARPTMEQPVNANEFGPRLLRSTTVFLLVIVSSTLTYGFGRVKSLISPSTPQARIEGYLRGQCMSWSPTPEGKKFTVRLTSGRSGHVENITTMAGRTGRTSFFFDVTPGVYKVTAISGSVSHHWALSYSQGSGSSPRIVPTPVAMNVPVPVVC